MHGPVYIKPKDNLKFYIQRFLFCESLYVPMTQQARCCQPARREPLAAAGGHLKTSANSRTWVTSFDTSASLFFFPRLYLTLQTMSL